MKTSFIDSFLKFDISSAIGTSIHKILQINLAHLTFGDLLNILSFLIISAIALFLISAILTMIIKTGNLIMEIANSMMRIATSINSLFAKIKEKLLPGQPTENIKPQ